MPDPISIVEVLSPSTSAIDRAWKLQEDFRLPSLCHYLIVWADKDELHRLRQLTTGKNSWIGTRHPELVIPKSRPSR